VAYDIETVKRQWEGRETPLRWGRYPVEHDPIRRHCHMVEDDNPRFLTEGWCPPVLVDIFAAAGPWPTSEPGLLGLIRQIPTPGDRLINLNQELEWFRAVRVGERLGCRHRILSVEVRPTRLDPLSVWVRTETVVVDARDEIVARTGNQILIHRTPEAVAAGAGPA
jgi:hypothetical protein